MGGCLSTMSEEERAEQSRDRALQKQGEKDHIEDQAILKLLLLGAGESGKSTLFKQMKILFSESMGFSDAEKRAGTKHVQNNVIGNMKILITNCSNHTPVENSELAAEISKVADDSVIDKELGQKILAMWNDAGVKATWQKRSSFQVQDSLEYYMENIDRISQPNYVASNQDILRARVRTSGIVEAEYNMNGVRIAMFDVGGQRNERKKWIHCFDNVTAVIFIAAISEYDQVLFEDTTKNRQEEALELFEEMCHCKWFKKKSMILFLNKRDTFRKKLTEVPFKVLPGGEEQPRNVDYEGPEVVPGTNSAIEGTPEYEQVYEATTSYLTNLYKSKSVGEGTDNRQVYVKLTCATDSDQVKVVMESCKDIILKFNLAENGFI